MSVSIPITIFCENCDNTQESNFITLKNIYKADVTFNVTTDILDPTEF